MDFYTEEYIDVYTKTGTVDDVMMKNIKDLVKVKMPNFDIENKLMPAQTRNCETVNAWGFI